MRLKSYFSGTVEAAMELAHKELGEEALLINARPSTPETRNLGAYEVVFGIAPKAEAEVETKPAANDSLAQDVAELRREMERMAQALRGGRAGSPEETSSDVYNLLVENELDRGLAKQVAAGAVLEELFEVD